MALIRANTGAGESAKGETFELPNDGASHTYEFPCTNACLYLIYNNTINIAISVIEGVLYEDKASAGGVSVTSTYQNGVLSVTIPSSFWGNVVRVVYG